MKRATLWSLAAIRTDDWSGRDELVIHVSSDGSWQIPIRKSALRGQVVVLYQTYTFRDTLTIALIEEDWNDTVLDAMSDLNGRANDFLGAVSISSTSQQFAQTSFFNMRRAAYVLSYTVENVFELSASVGRSGVNHPTDILALKERLHELGFDWLALNESMDADTIQTIKLFQSIINGRQSVQGDGRVDVPGPSYAWLRASNAPHWQVMPAGSPNQGFHNYELTDTTDHYDYGTDWLATTIQNIGLEYYRTYLTNHSGAALLSINDVSLARGGLTSQHAGHQTGLCCDIRLPHTDGTSGQITWSNSRYDREAMRAMLVAVRNQPLWRLTYFNDPQLIAEGLCTNLPAHDNHAHFEIRTPQRID
ncbi:MAG: hypothetical protein EYC68_08170 [Chloroflexota bacterium]|nr:MAG: hypothetical protein EYC68_08170 [Chloroflexota bacterium]